LHDPAGRYASYASELMTALLATPGATSRELRRAVLARATAPHPVSPSPLRVAEGGLSRRGGTNEELPPALAAYVDKVARHAYKVTDEDVAALQRAGNSDDALFEVTVAAAVGAALERLERGLAALRGEIPD
jgi:alkylhydroperoxidase family enzyme